MENTRRHDGICRRSSQSRRTLILCWATPSRAESMKRSVEIMKTRSKATLTLRAMLARRYGFGASPNKPPLCHLWPQRHCLPLSGSPKNGAKKQRPRFLTHPPFLSPLSSLGLWLQRFSVPFCPEHLAWHQSAFCTRSPCFWTDKSIDLPIYRTL